MCAAQIATQEHKLDQVLHSVPTLCHLTPTKVAKVKRVLQNLHGNNGLLEAKRLLFMVKEASVEQHMPPITYLVSELFRGSVSNGGASAVAMSAGTGMSLVPGKSPSTQTATLPEMRCVRQGERGPLQADDQLQQLVWDNHGCVRDGTNAVLLQPRQHVWQATRQVLLACRAQGEDGHMSATGIIDNVWVRQGAGTK